MKLPSLDSLVDKAIETFRRFPAVLLFAATGTVFSIALTRLSYKDNAAHHWYWNIILSAYLGMLLLLALTVFAERRELGRGARLGLQLAGILLAVVYYFFLPDHFREISVIRFILYALGLHWLIAFIPFTGRGEMNGFWQYNKMLFLRILTAILYTSVLYMGLSLALLAIDKLFKADIDYKMYIYLWTFLAGLFNTWFFLAGFPGEYASLETRTDYPKGLKIFTQYVLLPIITVYLLILYAYMMKIIVTAQWPVGWVSNLILGFSVAGILSLLLIHPVRNEDHNKWILVFSKFFYFALFPLLILLFFAIARRIRDYGITEFRYFVLLLAVWLAFIGIYFLVSVAKSIKLIPLSLCLVAFLSSFGPWGAFSISIASQKGRLVRLLEKNHMLADGKVIRADKQISFADRKKISGTIEYLVSTHGYSCLQPYFSRNLDSLMKTDSVNNDRFTYRQVNKIAALMDIQYVEHYVTVEAAASDNAFNIEASYARIGLDIEGYQYLIREFNSYSANKQNDCTSYELGKGRVDICFDPATDRLTVSGFGDSVLSADLDPMIRSLKDKGTLHEYSHPQDALTLVLVKGKKRCKIFLKRISGTVDGDKIEVINLGGEILLGRE